MEFFDGVGVRARFVENEHLLLHSYCLLMEIMKLKLHFSVNPLLPSHTLYFFVHLSSDQICIKYTFRTRH